MSLALLLKIIITTATTLAIAAIAWHARKYPNRSKDYPERVRMTKFVPFIGWLFICVGFLMGLGSLAAPGNPLGMQIASAAIILGGAAFVVMYRNFYVAASTYEVAFRSIRGKDHLIRYRDIVHYQAQMMKGQQFLTIKSVHGPKLSLNISAYDMTPLLRAIDFHRATGRWPVPAEDPRVVL